MSKVVFVGNVPYNMGEDQLIDVFKSVGHVVGFRLVFDRDTGKPKGYGFCEFADAETAASAVRNLNNTDVGGRPLRIDLADSDPFLEGKTTVRGEIVDGGAPGPSEPRSRYGRGFDQKKEDPFLAQIPSGIPIARGTSSLDAISQTLAHLPPSQLMEVLAQMKAFVITHPEQARKLLSAHPQLAYALFQALLLNKIVAESILLKMLQATSSSTPGLPPPPQSSTPLQPPPFQPPPMHQPQPMSIPPGPSMYPPPQHPPQPPGFYSQPPPSMPPPSAMAAAPQFHSAAPTPPMVPKMEITDAQRAMIRQVLSMSQDQINALPTEERNAIQQLHNQFGTMTA